MRAIITPSIVCSCLLVFSCERSGETGVGEIRGAARVGGTIYAWGNGVMQWESGRVRVLHTGRRFEPAGCTAELDGAVGLVLREGHNLVWVHGDGLAQTSRIDTEAGLSDCLATTLLGRRGLLVAHRGLQVRFYERPERDGERWPYREIYSFYTASYQSGLLLHDVDGDGRADILCGNYWIRSPEAFEMPWRLFAINTYNDTEHAAHLRLVMWGERLVVAQGELRPAKLALFAAGADPKQLWKETRLEGGLDLNHPAALASGEQGFVVGERCGRGRILRWAKHVNGELLGEGAAVVALFWDGPDGIVVVRGNGIERIPIPLK
ncbi:MAG: hypothetical protein HY820_24130 [Acidobacteria bacterium]|nr:hypothetical protein [Acidobacteriota bacterium]